MSYPFPPDLAQLVQAQMSQGGYSSEDDVLRDALHALGQFAHSREEFDEEFRQTVIAVREGVADAEAGRMRPLRELIAEHQNKSSFEKK